MLSVVGTVGDNGSVFGGGGANFSVTLKPLAERKIAATHVIARLRPKLAHIPGATLYLQAQQDIRAGGRSGNATYQYTLQGDAFARAILEGGEVPVSVEDAVANMAAIEALFRSAATQTWETVES